MALEERPKRGSIPHFLLTKKVPVVVISVSGGYFERGRWVEGEEVPRTIQANVQPLRFEETLKMEGADRTREWIKIYTTDVINTVEEKEEHEADLVEWQGHRYRAMRSRSYQMGTLDHNHILCVRIPETAL